MKTIKSALVVMSVLVFTNVNSQVLSAKAQERENNEIELLTEKEKREIQLWFYQEIQKMNMNEETLSEYESNLLVYTSKMMRLNDKDQDYTYDEIIEKLDILVIKLNNTMSKILSAENCKTHNRNTSGLIHYIKLKMEKSYLLSNT